MLRACAGVPAGDLDEVLERLVGHRHPAPRAVHAGQAALGVRQGGSQDRRHVLVRERLQAPDPHPGQERRVDLEVRVLGRRADEGDRAVLDVRQERVLLGLVEAVDLVDEQDRSAAVEGELVLGLGDRRADLGHARHDGRHGAELGADGVREQPGERRLAGAGRAPQEHRREVAAADGPAEWAALADEVRLAHELLEGARAQPGGQRLPLGRGLEQGFGASAGHGAPGRHAAHGRAGRRQPPIGMIPVTSIRIQRTSRIASRRLAILTMSLMSRAT